MRHKGMTVKSIVSIQTLQNSAPSNRTAANTDMLTPSASTESFKKFSSPLQPSISILNPTSTTTSTNVNEKHHITLPLLIPDKIEYCITGLYNLETFRLIVPTLLEIMFYETE